MPLLLQTLNLASYILTGNSSRPALQRLATICPMIGLGISKSRRFSTMFLSTSGFRSQPFQPVALLLVIQIMIAEDPEIV